jgi:hypothetical protein
VLRKSGSIQIRSSTGRTQDLIAGLLHRHLSLVSFDEILMMVVGAVEATPMVKCPDWRCNNECNC